jgi:C_GCAxxG_C_C family probable redox protein
MPLPPSEWQGILIVRKIVEPMSMAKPALEITEGGFKRNVKSSKANLFLVVYPAQKRLPMEERNGLSFNCAESVILGTSRNYQLHGEESTCLRTASVLGGGISGCGEVCGAVSGAVICLGLTFGTNGTELPENFRSKRQIARTKVKDFMKSFADAWGSVQCRVLLAMDKGEIPPEGSLRPEGGPRNLCNEYVRWSTTQVSRDLSDS